MNYYFKTFFSLSLLFLLAPDANATDIRMKFGKIAKKHLEMSSYELDANASAVVLAEEGKSYFNYDQIEGFQVVFERHVRIKIFNKNGYDWANEEILIYHDRGDKEVVTDLKGYTYNLVNGKIVKEKLTKAGIFKESYSSNWDKVKFAMPGVKEGSVIEYSYKITSDFKTLLRDWEFQKSIPVIWSEYEVEIPEYFYYLTISQGYEPFIVNEQSNSTGYFSYISKSEPEQPTFSGAFKRELQNHSVSYNISKRRWAAKDIPALKPEKYITTIDDYILKLEFQLANIQFPGSLPENILGSWEEVEQKLLNADGFGKHIRSYDFLQEELGEIFAEAKTPEEKMKMVHTFISDHFQWNESSGLMADDIEKAFAKGEGSASEINLLLIAMLREAGLQAEPVIMSTRENGKVHMIYPIISKFNYVIAHVNINGKEYFVDATEPILPCGMLPSRCLNRKGRLVADNNSRWIAIDPEEKYSRTTTAQFDIDANGRMKGSLEISSDGYSSLVKREILQKFSKRSYIGTVKRIEPEWSIHDFQVRNVHDFSGPLHEKYKITINETVPGSDMIYLNPIVVGREKENPFLMEGRSYPVDLEYPEERIYIAKFTVPEGYQIEDVPESTLQSLPGKAAEFDYSVTADGDMIEISSKISINKEQFLPAEYASLRKFYGNIVAKHAEVIVLKKINYERQ